jgi:GTPase Era involved in 16S rRNA processing
MSDKERKDLTELLSRPPVKLIIVGEVKTGKSTLWNAILGQAIFPSDAAPCTSRITVVRYANPPTVKLTIPSDITMSAELKQKVEAFETDGARQLAAAGGDGKIPDVLVARGKTGDAELEELISKVRQVEVGLTNTVLAHGLVTIDSPGLNESSALNELTLQHMKTADNVLFVFNASQGGFVDSSNETIQVATSNLDTSSHARGFDPLFVLNKIDMLRPEADEEDDDEERREKEETYQERLSSVCKYTFTQLKAKNTFPSVIAAQDFKSCRTLLPISAYNALQRIKKKKTVPKEFLAFMDAFHDFTQGQIFRPLVKAGDALEQHTGAFAKNLLEMQSSQHKFSEGKLAQIPKALHLVQQLTNTFVNDVTHRQQLLSAVTASLNLSRDWFVAKAQDWKSVLEADRVPSVSAQAKDDEARKLLSYLSTELTKHLATMENVKAERDNLQRMLESYSKDVVAKLKAVSADVGKLPSLSQALECSFEGPNSAVPTMGMARRNRKKVDAARYILAVPTLGVSLLARVKEPKWQTTKSWSDFKQVAAEHFFAAMDANDLTSACTHARHTA